MGVLSVFLPALLMLVQIHVGEISQSVVRTRVIGIIICSHVFAWNNLSFQFEFHHVSIFVSPYMGLSENRVYSQ